MTCKLRGKLFPPRSRAAATRRTLAGIAMSLPFISACRLLSGLLQERERERERDRPALFSIVSRLSIYPPPIQPIVGRVIKFISIRTDVDRLPVDDAAKSCDDNGRKNSFARRSEREKGARRLVC